jgi:glycosyltransferase involved in cell wall biosynthesis
MRCPSLSELPPPPSGKTGWPWTEESPQLPNSLPDGSDYPRISIVTPNYNYGRFIEETIRSVLLQGYPNLEYIIIDGGSTDDSVEIIKKYEPWLSYWVSEKDEGQTNAINKGLGICTGKIFNWINSDDQLSLGSLAKVASLWTVKNPDIIIGASVGIDGASLQITQHWQPQKPQGVSNWIQKSQFGLKIAQPSTFLGTHLFEQIGILREDLHYAFDWSLYLKILVFLPEVDIQIISEILSSFITHPAAKTSNMKPFRKEEISFLRELYPKLRFSEKVYASLYIYQVECQQHVNEVMQANNKRKLKKLAQLLYKYPSIALSRFFWGAFRRELF